MAASALLAVPAAAAPVLTSAEASVRFTSPLECEVGLTLTVTGASDVEHRLEVLEGASVTIAGLEHAVEARPAHDIGRTRALTLAPSSAGAPYVLRYRVQQASSRPGRCPIWLPTAPAAGRGRDVRVTVQVPDGTVPSGTMPTLIWQGTTGIAVLPHLPAFVIVPWAAAGESRPWDISRVMDVVALTSLAVASALWMRRRKGAH